MKLKLCTLTLAGLAAWSLAAVAQINPPAGELPSTTTSVTITNDAAQPDATPKEAPAKEAPAAEGTLLAANAPAADATPKPAAADATAGTNAPAATDAAAGTNATAQAGGVIPLIVMDDVPLTDAIKNLARQAGLNYMLDPKVAFGQVGADGKPVPQPTVSIRWENVTAE